MTLLWKLKVQEAGLQGHCLRCVQIICFKKFEEKGWDTADTSFNPSTSMCHYRIPIIYAEMLEDIADIQRRNVFDVLHDSLCYSVQIDGSMDKQQLFEQCLLEWYVVRNLVLKVFWIPCASGLKT